MLILGVHCARAFGFVFWVKQLFWGFAINSSSRYSGRSDAFAGLEAHVEANFIQLLWVLSSSFSKELRCLFGLLGIWQGHPLIRGDGEGAIGSSFC